MSESDAEKVYREAGCTASRFYGATALVIGCALGLGCLNAYKVFQERETRRACEVKPRRPSVRFYDKAGLLMSVPGPVSAVAIPPGATLVLVGP